MGTYNQLVNGDNKVNNDQINKILNDLNNIYQPGLLNIDKYINNEQQTKNLLNKNLSLLKNLSNDQLKLLEEEKDKLELLKNQSENTLDKNNDNITIIERFTIKNDEQKQKCELYTLKLSIKDLMQHYKWMYKNKKIELSEFIHKMKELGQYY